MNNKIGDQTALSDATPRTRRKARNLSKPTPFVKWAGGKTQILDKIAENIPIEYSDYVEPFLGGGAVFFWLWRTRRLASGNTSGSILRPLLSDSNRRLVGTYIAIRDQPDAVIEKLVELADKKNEKAYYNLREEWKEVTDPVYNAALFIYFNKLCFNGLYRENKNQEFNVPWGGKSRENVDLYDPTNISMASEALQNCDLMIGDFEDALVHAAEGSLVYLDPPYHFPRSTNGFTGYTSEGFDESEQARLAHAIYRLHEKGCKILISNSCTSLIDRLYPKKRGFFIEKITAKRLISCDPKGRHSITEALIRNYPGNETQQIRLVT